MAYMRPTVRQLRDEQKRTIAAGLEAEQWRTELNRMADRLGLVLDELGAPRTQANEQFGLSLEGRIRKLAAAAVAEARAPLVEALGRIAAKTTHINEKGCQGHLIFTQVEMAAIAAAALAKETP